MIIKMISFSSFKNLLGTRWVLTQASEANANTDLHQLGSSVLFIAIVLVSLKSYLNIVA